MSLSSSKILRLFNSSSYDSLWYSFLYLIYLHEFYWVFPGPRKFLFRDTTLVLVILFFVFCFFWPFSRHTKFSGEGSNPHQGSNPCHSSDPSHTSVNARSLTHQATRELHGLVFIDCKSCKRPWRPRLSVQLACLPEGTQGRAPEGVL